MTATAPPSHGALRAFHDCVEGMLADPDLGGDLLLVGIVMARRTHLGGPGSASAAEMAEMAFGSRDTITLVVCGSHRTTSRGIAQRWRNTMMGDIRRYDYQADPVNARPNTLSAGVPCGAPMIRRDTPCGRSATECGLATDPENGRRYWVGCCSRHRDWYRAARAANDAEVAARLPDPAANTGGVLRRHLPGFNWAAYWLRINPTWVEPPEEIPVVKPLLELILNDDFEETPAMPSPPRLALVPR